jgi:oxaloacetate decarboxylase alpha subunit
MLDAVLEEIPRVRADSGNPPLVTPSSQIVGTQAVFNVLFGERYKTVTKEFKAMIKGEYGQTPMELAPEFVKKILGDEERITCRPADLLKPELEELRAKCAQYMEQDEDVLSYALLEQVAEKFFEYRKAQKYNIDATNADKELGVHSV